MFRNRMTKRILAFALCALLTAGIMPESILAAEAGESTEESAGISGNEAVQEPVSDNKTDPDLPVPEEDTVPETVSEDEAEPPVDTENPETVSENEAEEEQTVSEDELPEEVYPESEDEETAGATPTKLYVGNADGTGIIDILHHDGSLPGGIEYVPGTMNTTSTLKLTGRGIYQGYYDSIKKIIAGIYCEGDLILELGGTNTILFAGISDANEYGIYVNGNLTIKSENSETATLFINKCSNSSSKEAAGIYCAGTLTLMGNDKLTINAEASDCTGNGSSIGIYCGSTFESTYGASVNATGGTYSGSNTVGGSYGMLVDRNSATITSNQKSKFNLTGGECTDQGKSYGLSIPLGSLLLSNSELTTTGGKTKDGNSCGLSTRDGSTVQYDAKLTSKGSDTSGKGSSIGIYSPMKITDWAEVDAAGGNSTGGISCGINNPHTSSTFEMENGTLTVVSGKTNGNNSSYGMNVRNLNVGGDITATGGPCEGTGESVGINYTSESTKINGGSIRATGGSSKYGSSYGIKGMYSSTTKCDFYIMKSTNVSAESGDVYGSRTGCESVGIVCDELLLWDNTRIEAKAGKALKSEGINAYEIRFRSNYTHIKPIISASAPQYDGDSGSAYGITVEKEIESPTGILTAQGKTGAMNGSPKITARIIKGSRDYAGTNIVQQSGYNSDWKYAVFDGYSYLISMPDWTYGGTPGTLSINPYTAPNPDSCIYTGQSYKSGSYNSSSLPSDAGTYHMVAKWNDGHTAETDFEINRRIITDGEVTMAPSSYSVVYDGNTKYVQYPTVKYKETALTTGTDYIITGDASAKDVGTYFATVAGKGNFTSSTYYRWNITKATPTRDDFTVSSYYAKPYTGQPVAVDLPVSKREGMGNVTVYYEGVNSDTYYYGPGNYTTTIPTEYAKSTTPPTKAGYYEVTFNVASGSNYNAASGLKAGLFRVYKKTYEGIKRVDAYVKQMDEDQTGLTLELPEMPAGATCRVEYENTSDQNYIKNISISGRTLTYDVRATYSIRDITVNVVVESVEYDPYTIVVYFNGVGSGKNEAIISVDGAENGILSKTYGDADFYLPVIAKSKSGSELNTQSDFFNYEIEDVKDGSVDIDNYNGLVEIKNAGDTAIRISSKMSNYYGSTVIIVSVAKKTVSINGLKVNDKVYNGNREADVDYSNVTLDGIADKDKSSMNYTRPTGLFADKDAAVRKPVALSENISLTYNATSYDLIQPTGLSANITPKQLTISLRATDRVYQPGNKKVNMTGSITGGRIDGDMVELDLSDAVGEMADDSVGNSKSVTVSAGSIKLRGDDAGNYRLPDTLPTVTVNISKARWMNTDLEAYGSSGKEKTVNLSANKAPGGSFGAVSVTEGSAFLESTPSIDGDKLKFEFRGETSEGTKAKLTIPVTSANYDNYNIEVTLIAEHHHITVSVNEVEPKCDENGNEACWRCRLCGKYYKDKDANEDLPGLPVKAALGHIWGDWIVTKEPTSSETGEQTRECSRCHEKEKEVLPVVPGVFKVTFSLNGKNGTAPAVQDIQQGKTAVKPADPTAEGFTFLGWFKDAAGEDYYDFNTPVTGNMTLYAKWVSKEVKLYTVSFDLNGKDGTKPADQKVAEGSMAGSPGNPTAAGFIFRGWYTDKDCKSLYDFSDPVTADITLYARWEEDVPPGAFKIFYTQSALAFDPYKGLTYNTGNEHYEWTYTGSALKPAITVTDHKGNLLTEGSDYTVKYTGNKDVSAKPAKVTVTGKGNFSGSRSLEFYILKADLAKAKAKKLLVVPDSFAVQKGKKIAPVVIYQGITLDAKKNYKLSNTGAIKEDTTVDIEGKGTFFTGKISGIPVKALSVEEVKNNTIKVSLSPEKHVYTGSAQELSDKELVVKAGSSTSPLAKGKDYKVIYSKNTDAGKAKVTVMALGSYIGNVSKTFTIEADTKSNITAALKEGTSTGYDPKGATPALNVKTDKTTLKAGKDYKVTYSNNKSKGEADYKLTFIGNFKGHKAVTGKFTITEGAFASASVNSADLIYGKPNLYRSAPFVSIGGVSVGKKDYTVKYFDGTKELGEKEKITLDAGQTEKTITVKATGKNNYKAEDSAAFTYRVVKVSGNMINLSKAKIVAKGKTKAVGKQEYTGEYVMPEIDVLVKQGKTWVALDPANYTVAYINNINKGKATILVTGKGTAAAGSKTAKFTIKAKNMSKFNK